MAIRTVRRHVLRTLLVNDEAYDSVKRMFFGIKDLLGLVPDIWFVATNFNRCVPAFMFDQRPNVGDALNLTLIPKLAGKKVYSARSRRLPHLLAIGSLLDKAGPESYVWGTGSIDGAALNRRLNKEKIFALRGYKTQALIREHFSDKNFSVPLGDPAILLPEFFAPKIRTDPSGIGVVAHFVDEYSAYFRGLRKNDSIRFISVSLPPEEFVERLVSCKYIISSSLHGLIIADSYAVPNKWIVVSDKIIGGSFKFRDYYSTTNRQDESPFLVDSIGAMELLVSEIAEITDVAEFRLSKQALLESFPDRFCGSLSEISGR